MTADLVNLRQFKKRKKRQEKERVAQNNRIAFGRSKSEKTLTREINRRQEQVHESGRLEKQERGSGQTPQK